MEVAGDGFEAGHRLVGVVVGVGHHLLLRGVVAARAQVVVDRHALHGSGRRVVERVVVDLRARYPHAAVPHFVGDAPRRISLAALRLHDAQRERRVVVFAVIDVAQVDFVFAREEELVRRRENGERAGARVENLQPVARPEVDRLLVHVAAELVLLPDLRVVAPRQLCVV